MIYRFNLF